MIPRRFLLVLTTFVVALSTVAPARGTVGSGGAAPRTPRHRAERSGQRPRRVLVAAAVQAPDGHPNRDERSRRASTSTPRSASSPTVAPSSPARTPASPNPVQGWGIFRLRGHTVGKLSAKQIGKLQPTYQGATDNAENYGCGVLSDGRVVTTRHRQPGGGRRQRPAHHLVPAVHEGLRGRARTGRRARCRTARSTSGSRTAGGIAVDERGPRLRRVGARHRASGVCGTPGRSRRRRDASGGCDDDRRTGAPLTDVGRRKEPFIAAGEHGLGDARTRSSPRPDGGWYVSSVFTGVINEYDADGHVRAHRARAAGGRGARPRAASRPARRSGSASRPTAPSTSPTSGS